MEKNNLSSPLAKRDKKEKYIIYFVGAALLFFLVGLKEISQSNPYLSAPTWFGFLATNTSYLFAAYTRKKLMNMNIF